MILLEHLLLDLRLGLDLLVVLAGLDPASFAVGEHILDQDFNSEGRAVLRILRFKSLELFKSFEDFIDLGLQLGFLLLLGDLFDTCLQSQPQLRDQSQTLLNRVVIHIRVTLHVDAQQRRKHLKDDQVGHNLFLVEFTDELDVSEQLMLLLKVTLCPVLFRLVFLFLLGEGCKQ